MRACLRFRLRVLGYAWWLLLLLPTMALLMGWEASAVPEAYLRRGSALDPRSALALVLDTRHFFPLAGAVWAILFLGMDYNARAVTLPLSRGYSLGQVFWSKYLLFLLGCVLASLMEQGFAMLTAVPTLRMLPTSFLLRCLGLRLLLDLGMMVLPACPVLWGRESVWSRILALIYGVALWRLMKSHYTLWLQYADWRTDELWALWPLAGLILGVLVSRLAAVPRKAAD